MKMNKLIIFVVLIILGSCSQGRKTGDLNPNLSPFSSEVMFISGNLRKEIVAHNDEINSVEEITDAAIVPEGIKFGYIVKDQCIKDRLNNASGKKISYFVDKFVKKDELANEEDPFNQSVVNAQVGENVSLGDLKKVIKVDRCVIAAADQNEHHVNSAGYSDAYYGSQDYLKQIGFSAADEWLKKNLPADIKVNVAVIDSGYDLGSDDQPQMSENLEGSDVYNLDDTPEDIIGHGTEVANVIAAKANSKGVVGMAHRNVVITPIRAFKDKEIVVDDGYIFKVIKRAVNAGADVINMSFSAIIDREGIIGSNRELDKELYCSPLIGHALYQAIAKRVFFSMAAGHGTSYEKWPDGKWKKYKLVNEKLELCPKDGGFGCKHKKAKPGPVMAPKDNGPALFGNTSVPACWGRYFKGALAVASVDQGTNKISSFSNWGSDGVEIAAPGSGVRVSTLNNKSKITKGTSFSAPQVSAAAALVIAFHKYMQKQYERDGKDPNEWHYSPWSVENILLNGINDNDTLANDAKGIRKGKVLNLTSITQYLAKMINQSFDERRMQEDDNTEVGQGWDVAKATEDIPKGVSLLKVSISSNQLLFRNRDKSQLQLTAYYSNGATKVVTTDATWRTSLPVVKIDEQGIAYPDLDFTGSVIITGEYKGKSAHKDIFVGNVDVVSGRTNLRPDKIEIVPVGKNVDVEVGSHYTWKCCFNSYEGDTPDRSSSDTFVLFKAFGHYADGSKRDITRASSWSVNAPHYKVRQFGDRVMIGNGHDYPGKKHTVTALYSGRKAKIEFSNPFASAEDYFIHYSLKHTVGSKRNINGKLESDGETITFYKGDEIELRSRLSFEVVGYERVMHNLIAADFVVNGKSTKSGSRLGNALRLDTDDLGLGIHTVEVKSAPFRGSGVDQTFTRKFKINVIKRQPISIYAKAEMNGFTRQRDLDAFKHGDLNRISVYMKFDEGEDSKVDPNDLDVVLVDENGKQSKYNYIQKNGGVWKWISISFWESEKIGQNYTLQITHKSSGLKTSVSKKTFGLLDVAGEVSLDPGDELKLDNIDQKFSNKYVTVKGKNLSVHKVKDPYCTSEVMQKRPFAKEEEIDRKKYKYICNEEQFMSIFSSERHSDTIFVLLNHLNFSKYGNMIDKVKKTELYGLHGNFYKISNVTMIDAEQSTVTLFKEVKEVKELVISDFIVKGRSGVASLASYIRRAYDVYLTNSYLEGYYGVAGIATNQRSGMSIAGYEAEIKRIWASGNTLKGQNQIGGILLSANHIVDSYVDANISSIMANTSMGMVGGLVSRASGSCHEFDSISDMVESCQYLIMNNLVTGKIKVSGGTGSKAGGILGSAGSPIILNKSYAHVESTGDNVGGIAGDAQSNGYNTAGVIYRNYFNGQVYGRDDVGGLIGNLYNAMVIENIVEGSVSAVENVGGVIGSDGATVSILRRNDATGVSIHSENAKFSSGFIGLKGHKRVPASTLHPDGKFQVPSIIKNNRYEGDFIGNNIDELTEAMTKMMDLI